MSVSIFALVYVEEASLWAARTGSVSLYPLQLPSTKDVALCRLIM
jgi:hypothetical protein